MVNMRESFYERNYKETTNRDRSQVDTMVSCEGGEKMVDRLMKVVLAQHIVDRGLDVPIFEKMANRQQNELRSRFNRILGGESN